GLGQSVPLAQAAKLVTRRELLEHLAGRTGIDHHDPVDRPQAELQAHLLQLDLSDHRVVAWQQLVGIAVESPDRGMHQPSTPPVSSTCDATCFEALGTTTPFSRYGHMIWTLCLLN